MKFAPHFLFLLLLTGCVSQNNEIDGDNQRAAKARVELALGYLAQQDYAQAKQNLDKAQQHAPDYYLVQSAFAYFYQQQGEIEAARQAYAQALKLDNKQGDFHNNYGVFLCQQGDFSTAYQQFDLAIQSPNYYRQADSYENKALCAQSANHIEVYQQSLQALMKLEPARAQKLPQ